jgi:hypothetical protein
MLASAPAWTVVDFHRERQASLNYQGENLPFLDASDVLKTFNQLPLEHEMLGERFWLLSPNAEFHVAHRRGPGIKDQLAPLYRQMFKTAVA